MADNTNLGDQTTLAGVAAAATAGGAVLKTVFDWLAGRRKEQVSAEELVRDDLMTQLREQRAEIVQLRGELGEARKELRELTTLHQTSIKEWQDRYTALLLEMADLRTHLEISNQMSQKTTESA